MACPSVSSGALGVTLREPEPRAATVPGRWGGLAGFLEDQTVRAWPTLEEIWSQGWLLRFGKGFMRRANCVVPLVPAAADARELVEFCEAQYASRGLEARFKMVPELAPPEVAGCLEGKGYVREGETLAMVRLLEASVEEPLMRHDVSALDRVSWAAAYARCAGLNSQEEQVLRVMLERMHGAFRLAAVSVDGDLVSCGAGVCRDGWMGIFCVATEARQRNRGHGHELVRSLLFWGRNEGAQKAYLQAGERNGPALHLYRGLGFRPAYSYHYLVRPACA